MEADKGTDVCMGTIFAPMADNQAYDDGTVKMLKEVGGHLMKVPRLYQKLLGLVQ